MTSVALLRRGIAVTLFERSAQLREIGAGVTLWPNAMRALLGLGLADAVITAEAPALLGEVRSRSGETLLRPPFDDLERRFGEPGVAIHHADLLALLLAALDPVAPRLGARCVGFEEDVDPVAACLGDGGRERADGLVGADGLRSAVRARLWGETPLRYAGYTAWCGVAPAAVENAAFESWGRGERFGLVPIGPGRVSWFAVANVPEGGRDASDPRPGLLQRFGARHPPVPAVIAATPAPGILRHDAFDRLPLPRWGMGRVTLLGDAAHPMTPDLGQGACQAIEDALALAECLDRASDVPAALRAMRRAAAAQSRPWSGGRAPTAASPSWSPRPSSASATPSSGAYRPGRRPALSNGSWPAVLRTTPGVGKRKRNWQRSSPPKASASVGCAMPPSQAASSSRPAPRSSSAGTAFRARRRPSTGCSPPRWSSCRSGPSVVGPDPRE